MISVVIVAGGKGTRMGLNINKQYLKIKEKEVLTITLEAFHKIDIINEIIVVVGEEEIDFCMENVINKYNFRKVKRVVAGGMLRQQSVYNGLVSCNSETEIVLIHDGARPFVSQRMITDSIKCAKQYGACTVAVPIKDTIKVGNSENFLVSTLNRDNLYSIQTPQTFRMDLILRGHEECIKNKVSVTDDTKLIEVLGKEVKIVEGSYFNIKLTTPEDLIFGKAILEYIETEGYLEG